MVEIYYKLLYETRREIGLGYPAPTIITTTRKPLKRMFHVRTYYLEK